MIVYLDSSIVLRKLLLQKGAISGDIWARWERAFTSNLLRLEVLRTLDNARLLNELGGKEIARIVQSFLQMMQSVGEIPVSPNILHRAALSYPTPLRSLDAIHLASALVWRENEGREITVLTHYAQLGHAARAVGLQADGFD